MKQLLLIIIVLVSLLSGQSVYAQSEWNGSFVVNKKEIPLKNIHPGTSTGGKGKVQHSPAQFPITAFIYGETLTVDFLSFLEEAITITITNADKGEIIYSESYTSLGCIVIQLGLVEDGTCYQLEIKFGSWVLDGEVMM